MRQETAKTGSRASRVPTDYTDPAYWNGLIKMSMSKFFVLCVLTRRPMHGYEITKAVADTTNGCCAPTPGSLYPVLREFEEGGYVTSFEETVNGRGRKVYTITDRGRQAFGVAARVWVDIGKCAIAGAEDACNADGCC